MDAARRIETYTVAEFLELDLDDEWHHELIDGRIVSMSPPGGIHQVLHGRLNGLIFAALQANRPRCNVRPQAGIAADGLEGDQWYEADLAVNYRPPRPGDEGIVEDPVLIIEILSPSTVRKDKRKKLPTYLRIAAVQEVVYVESEKIEITVHRRAGAEWCVDRLGAGDTLGLDSIGLSVPVAALYAGTGLAI